ncbi:hypothetical protein [Dysgonomonas sp. 520]|uniref:hypothetical protein n=1 Tax=Dysgonomonas sp. 520 TaxID=2302931 RepID=UPI0013CF9D50|nr:hypothetical protein [Dysgonomonas sp. 520]
MEKTDYSEKKRRGDAPMITKYLAKNGIVLSKRMVSYMLNGERTMPDDVRAKVDEWYEIREKLRSQLSKIGMV